MGCTHSSANKETNKVVEKKLKDKFNENRRIVRLLMLGTGESGKSTFVKQIYNLHGSGYSDSEKKNFLQLIRSNIVQCVTTVINGMNNFQISFDDDCVKEKVKFLMDSSLLEKSDINSEEIRTNLTAITTDPGFLQALDRKNELQLMDSFEYYLSDLTCYFKSDYEPNATDIVAARSKTTGIQETHIEVNSCKITLIDVGGQRGERRKWIHCFDDVSAVLFVVALNEFDQLLSEDNTTNRMVESLNLFDSISNNTYFIKKPMMLFLNKEDLFKKKLEKVKFSDFFTSYTESNTSEEVQAYITSQFLQKNKNEKKKIYTHITTATNPINVQLVFKSVLDITVAKNLVDVGLV